MSGSAARSELEMLSAAITFAVDGPIAPAALEGAVIPAVGCARRTTRRNCLASSLRGRSGQW